jgi:phosphoglycolate phosphatase
MTVCFDLDGTLLYTLEDLHNALNHSLKKYGYKEVSLDETRLNVGNGIRNLIIDSAKSSDNIDLMFSEFKKYYEVHCTDNTLPYIGMVKLVSDLKNMGYKISCVSNKHYVTLNKLINYYFPNMFDIVLGDGMGYERKPNPNIIYTCAKKLDEDLSNFIYIGDSDIDAKTIINANIKGILVSYGYRDKSILKEFMLPIADNVYELLNKISEFK